MTFIITAGPTREHLDPVRFLSNPSTGKMGFAVAQAAAQRGHKVILVAGPVTQKTPRNVTRIDVISARDMLKAVQEAVCKNPAAVLIATAAVADWRPAKCAARKLKKTQMSNTLRLIRNPDILKSIKGIRKIGFAAETNDLISEARRKCRAKKLEMIVANDVTKPDAGFGTNTNRVTFLYADGRVEPLPLMSKLAVARRIIATAEKLTSR
jgi:phosphopantothenoylcysteine decarboxylase / phosphopantothenate---cysteine ligase